MRKKVIDSTLHLRIDESTKEKAKDVCERHGISLSDAVRFFISKIAREEKVELESSRISFK